MCANRKGFTLIELLVSIIIVGILMALLLPAIASVRRNVQVSQVRSEIAGLESAIADFKLQFGQYPPSRIRIYEAATGDPSWEQHGAAGSPDDLERSRSVALIRSMWPQFGFAANNLDGDADTDEVHELTGSECLVFFLGGVVVDGIPTGFSANPANPLSTGGSNRIGPFYNLLANRLIDVDNDGLREYADTLPAQTQPYLYAATQGSIYNPDDLAPTTMTDVYRQNNAATSPPAWGSGVQLISPGFDGAYGLGGAFPSEDADGDGIRDLEDTNGDGDLDPGEDADGDGLLDHERDTNGNNQLDTDADTILSGTRDVERDNVTNFHSGMLGGG